MRPVLDRRSSVAVGAVIVLVALTSCGSDGPDRSVRTTPGWSGLEDFPLAARSFPALAWTGEEFVVFGGESHDNRSRMVVFLNDGAAYNPDTGSWRELAAAPYERSLLDVSATWTGEELLVIGVPCENYVASEETGPHACFGDPMAMAAYSLSRDTWREIDVPTMLKSRYRSPVALGKVGNEAIFDFGKEYWAYSPRKDDWRRAPDPPFAPREFCVTDDRLTAVAFDDRSRWEQDQLPTDPQPGLEFTIPLPPADFRVSLRASVLDSQANGWSPVVVPSDNAAAPNVLNVLCAGPRMLAFGSDFPGKPPLLARFDVASSAWTTLATPPVKVGYGVPTTWTGDQVLVWDHSLLGYKPANNQWSVIQPMPDAPRETIWVGDRAVVYDDSITPQFSAFVP